MSQEERWNTRDRTYSAWHRRQSTRRFIGIESAQVLAMIDLDASLYVEYDDGTKEPLALIETANDTGQSYKPATVTQRLAVLSKLPAYVLLYKKAPTRNPADTQWADIAHFRSKRLWPHPSTEWQLYTPKQWADQLLLLRRVSAKEIDQGIRKQLDPLMQLQEWWDITPQLDREKFAHLVLEWIEQQEEAA